MKLEQIIEDASAEQVIANQIATKLWNYAGHQDNYPYIVDDILEEVQRQLLERQRNQGKKK